MINLIDYGIGKLRTQKKLSKLRKIYTKFQRFTMISERTYTHNLLIAEGVSNLDGCIIECGVWRGGMIAGLADLLGNNRNYYLFDSFQGLPEAQTIDGEAAIRWQSNTSAENYYENCYAPREYAQKAMEMSIADNFFLKEGWFEETLPNFRLNEKIAFLRLDADWYKSTYTCLENLFDLVVEGGIIVLDDYYTWDGCSRAVHDFLSKTSKTERIESFNGICVIKKKEELNYE
jgi:O-methyltransferase